MRHLSSYIQTLFFAVLFLLFISGSIGWAIIYAVVGVGVFSVVTLLVSLKHFTVRLSCTSGTAERGGTAEITVTVEKTGFCFIPNMDITLILNDGETIRVRTALTLSKSVSVKVPVTARYSGLNRCAADSVVVQDIWNVILMKKPLGDIHTDYCVLPAYTDYIGPVVMPKLLPAEDDEAEEGRSVAVGGLPGYEHRAYEPGDSLRRINYKLSAKLGKLMVRLDEATGTAPVVISLAGYCFPDAGELLMALSRTLVLQGGSVKVSQGSDAFCANSPQTLSRLREWISSRPLMIEGEKNCSPSPNADVVFDENGIHVCGGAAI